MAYPSWSYFPRNVRPPTWVNDLVALTISVQDEIATDVPVVGIEKPDRTSDAILAKLTPGMQSLGYQVETGKKRDQKITRPVLYGDDGIPDVSYDIDAFHDGLGIAVEVEAGRGAANSADYRDIVRTSLLLDAEYLAMFMPLAYRSGQGKRATVMPAYNNTRRQLNAIYASLRLRLPFKGILLVGY